MNTTSLKLIPASNFEVRNLEGLKLQVSKNEYMILSGWGIWDKTAKAYVRFSDSKIKVLGQNRFIEAPYSLRRKETIIEVCGQGLYEGYLTISI